MTSKNQRISFVTKEEEEDSLETLPCQLPPKEINPRSFNLPRIIGNLKLYDMADLGADVNVMHKSLFEHLELADLKEANMVVEMADITKKASLGIMENILEKIYKFLFDSDFVVIDMLEGFNETMLLGRPFLATIHAQKDVVREEILLGIGPTCNPDLSFCSGYDAIYRKEESGMLKQWICFRDHETQNVKGNGMIFLDFLKVRDNSFKEWVEIKLRHTNISETIKCELFKEWIKENFNPEVDFERTRDYLYSMIFYVYKEEFDNEIEQLVKEYELKAGRKRYALDELWEKCEKFHDTTKLWYDKGFKEEELWENGIEEIDYTPPKVLSGCNHTSYAVTDIITV
nr:hypothetical protein [Tanacetum cinerariifolium]GEX75031.1 hypothetical protein [Tanacetum cinerariifolium]GEY28233.1 hypothetical protein [Tanacetum cinerariifolium]